MYQDEDECKDISLPAALMIWGICLIFYMLYRLGEKIMCLVGYFRKKKT